jgi:hypothetical protein
VREHRLAEDGRADVLEAPHQQVGLLRVVRRRLACDTQEHELSFHLGREFPRPEQRLEAAGVKNVLTKSMGSNNHIAVVNATLAALQQLRTSEDITTIRKSA